jgi:hypothetical protein
MNDNTDNLSTSSSKTAEKDDISEIKSNTSPSKRTFLEVNDIEKYKKFLVKPLETKKFRPSEALSRVRDFMPLFKESTDKLLDEHKANPEVLNIENVQEDEEHIEMNLALIPDESDEEDSDELEEDERSDSNSNETSSSDDYNEENENNETSSSSVEDINLGFKVKNVNKLKKLKLSTQDSSKSKTNKNMIQIIQNQEEDDQESSNQENMSKKNN